MGNTKKAPTLVHRSAVCMCVYQRLHVHCGVNIRGLRHILSSLSVSLILKLSGREFADMEKTGVAPAFSSHTVKTC